MTELDDLLTSSGAAAAIAKSRTEYLLAMLAQEEPWTSDAGPFALDALAQVLEGLALAEEDLEARRRLFEGAFVARRRLTGETAGARLVQLAHLAAVGVLAQRGPEVLMLLRQEQVPEMDELEDEQPDFATRLLHRVLRAFVLLMRRGGGWEDVRAAALEIEELRGEHSGSQDAYLEASSDIVASSIRLIAGFNLARVVDLAATYTASGTPANVELQLDRHAGNLRELASRGPDLGVTADLVVAASRHAVRSSVWQGTGQLGRDLRAFVTALASPDRSDPMLELWPSQRTALAQHLLDPARRAVVVEMPTSAGKTLLAEFSIIQARALNPDSAIAYVVPTRALVNQVTQRLRRDLGPLGLVVEAAVPVFELDPTEDVMLRDRVDVLVCTPEKLDLLLKADHPSVATLSLLVMDEAHNLADSQRGVRMELLLGAVKRERQDTRFLLLTPFVPNATDLATWLGDGADATIAVRWRPSERVAATAHWPKRRGGDYILTLTTLASADNVDVPAGHEVELASSAEKVTSKAATTSQLAMSLAERGAVLVLARGRGTAETRAKEIGELREQKPPSDLALAVQHYAESELGTEHPLPGLLKRGVTYHHAALSHDLRFFLELLIDEGDVDVVCGTTTLAQGLNFPISAVVIETLTKPLGFGKGAAELTHSEFWNIAGRAGRALRDPLGLVVFPALAKQDRLAVTKFLKRDAIAVASALIDAAVGAGQAVSKFDLKFVRENPSLSVFLQYLMHATRVAGAEQTAADLEDILRSSLVYHQAQNHDHDLAEALLSVARRFIAEVAGVDRGFLALADGTGFSLASARYVFARGRSEHPEFSQSEFWRNENLFAGDLRGLTSLVEVLAEVPEMTLGVTEDEGGMDPRRVAGIMSSWVSGAPIFDIAEEWFGTLADTPEGRARKASEYVYTRLVGQVPWGLGALQRLLLPPQEESDEVTLAARHIPSMVFYGVPTEHAAVMRMGGVPRVAAVGLGQRWSETERERSSFAQLRGWLGDLTDGDWAASLRGQTALTGNEAAMLWRRLSE